MFQWYEHHGVRVCVRNDLRGRHREFCLCHSCAKLDIKDRDKNCPIAALLYRLDILAGIITPVFECPKFRKKE